MVGEQVPDIVLLPSSNSLSTVQVPYSEWIVERTLTSFQELAIALETYC